MQPRCRTKPDPRRGRRCRAAFTLFELIVVMTIIAALSTLAIASFASALARHSVDALARRVAADMAFAAQQARIHGAAQAIEFDTANERYELVDLSSLDRSDKPYVVDVDAPPYNGDLVTAVVGGDTTLRFDAYGRPDSVATITVDVGGLRRRIRVSASAGVVTISEAPAAIGG